MDLKAELYCYWKESCYLELIEQMMYQLAEFDD